MILRRFYITENANGAVNHRFPSFHLLTSPDPAPIPRSKVNRLLKTTIQSNERLIIREGPGLIK
jgi:hypothetical protein